MESKIYETIALTTGVALEQIKSDSRLVEDLGIDSLDRLEITLAIDEEFLIEVSDDISSSWKTVSDIEHTIVNLVSERETKKQQAIRNANVLGTFVHRHTCTIR